MHCAMYRQLRVRGVRSRQRAKHVLTALLSARVEALGAALTRAGAGHERQAPLPVLDQGTGTVPHQFQVTVDPPRPDVEGRDHIDFESGCSRGRHRHSQPSARF